VADQTRGGVGGDRGREGPEQIGERHVVLSHYGGIVWAETILAYLTVTP
jgi:hypothetical protein